MCGVLHVAYQTLEELMGLASIAVPKYGMKCINAFCFTICSCMSFRLHVTITVQGKNFVCSIRFCVLIVVFMFYFHAFNPYLTAIRRRREDSLDGEGEDIMEQVKGHIPRSNVIRGQGIWKRQGD